MPEPEESQNINDTVDEVLGLARRRRWWIILPVVSVAIISSFALPLLPKRYTSDATLVVVQQQVSPVYVTPTTTVNASDAARNLTREVLSRPRLLAVIADLKLYPRVRPTDALADRMRDGIGIQALDANGTDYSSFKLSFSANSPQLAQAVTSRLASLFIEENLKNRSEQAEGTAQFLRNQLAEAKRKLDEQESRLRDFKLRNLGQLPEEQTANVIAVTALRAQLQTTLDSLSRAQRLRESLESTLSGNLERLAAERSNMLTTITPKHPAVVAKDQEIARTRDLFARLRNSGTPDRGAGDIAPDDIAFAQMRTQVDTNASEILSLTNEQKRLESEIGKYQRRLSLTPVAEANLAAILRDREQFTQDYGKLLNQQQQSQMTANLEERQQGQHFRLIDPPSIPIAPSSPDPRKVLLGGLSAGIILGLGLAFLMEKKDNSFHTERELAAKYSAPLVVAVPLMITPAEARTRRIVLIMEGMAMFALVAGVVAAELLAYFDSFPS